jgi:exodeoxyribonuclease VII large subunit
MHTGNDMEQPKSVHIYTVSHLTREIKTILEDRFSFVWITGEISNYAAPASGHSYFSLKDAQAVINCVMFKNQKRSLKFALENGLKIFGLARLTLYEPRGSYQLIFEHVEPEGAGALQKAFEQLKKKLGDEGLFDAVHKQPLPYLPQKISVITSGTGAAVRDIIHIAQRRFPNCCLQIVPVMVQGDPAQNEIVCAIEAVNQQCSSDVIILARGGGALEDLAAFNSEIVARAIFASKIPVVTGIGHETDSTIADFTADVRAPTPSAAAELVLPEKKQLARHITDLHFSLSTAITQKLAFFHQKVDDLHSRLKSPVQVVANVKQTIETHFLRMQHALDRQIFHGTEKLSWISQALSGAAPQLQTRTRQVADLCNHLAIAIKTCIFENKHQVRQAAATLAALDPASVLKRGFSIARTLPDKKVILDADTVAVQDRVEIILSKGRIQTRVEKKIHGKDNI